MLSIGELSRRTGVKVTTIRFYETKGLIADPGRSDGGQRRYGRTEQERLTFIRHARDLGLPLDSIRALIDMDSADHAAAHGIAHDHLADVRNRISRLRKLESELTRIAAACKGGENAPCRIVTAFGDHDSCNADHV